MPAALLGTCFLLGAWVGVIGVILVAVVGIGAVCSIRLRDNTWIRQLALIIPFVLLAVLGTARAATIAPIDGPKWADEVDRVTGRVVSPPRSDGRYQRFEVGVDWVRVDGQWMTAEARLRVVAAPYPRVRFGDEVSLPGTATPIEDIQPGYRDYLRGRGNHGTFFAQSVLIRSSHPSVRQKLLSLGRDLTDFLRTAVPGDAGALLAGLVTGDDTAMTEEQRSVFWLTGTTHITAVSGSNIALVVGALAAAGGLAGVSRRTLWVVLIIVAVWAYAGIVGTEPPAARAATMASLAVLGARFGRRSDYLTLAVITAAVMVAWDPKLLDSIGFQLSFASSLALAAVVRQLRVNSLATWFALAFAGAAVAQFATLPVLIARFGALSPLSLPTNLLIAPLVSVAFPLALIAAVVAMLSPELATAVASVAGVPAEMILQVVERFGGRTQTLVGVGRGNAHGQIGLLITVTVGLTVASADGRRWIGRLPRRWR